jgi:hypothetical protein
VFVDGVKTHSSRPASRLASTRSRSRSRAPTAGRASTLTACSSSRPSLQSLVVVERV